jgi:predicted nucleic acid-binding Zn ribbon protein
MLDNASPVPFYEYRRPDGTTLEVMQKMTDPPLTEDPESGVPLQRVFHPIAVHFKGKGFYNTDYGTKKRQREQAKSEEGKKSAESGSGEAKSGDAKSGEAKSGGDASSGASTSAESSSSSSSSSSKPETPSKASSSGGGSSKKSGD